MLDFGIGPQRKHHDFFKFSTVSRNTTPSIQATPSAVHSDSGFDYPEAIDSDLPLESSMEMFDIPQPPSSSDVGSIRQRKAWAWNHGFLDDNRWQCKYCSKSYDSSAMTHPNTHLSARHNIRDEQQRGKPIFTRQFSENSKSFFMKRAIFKPETFRSCLIDWVLRDRISFHEIESEPFREMIASLRPEALEVLNCANTIRAHCLQQFQAARENMKQLFTTAKSKIHISADLWTSPNNYALLGIVAHW